MTKTLNTKQGTEWTNDLGQTFPAQQLYRFTDENGEGPGVWYAELERADKSWQRWIEAKPVRDRRKAESARLRAAVAAHKTPPGDPFAQFDR